MHELKTIDLGVVVPQDAPKELVGSRRRMSEIYMMDIDAGASYWLKVGEGNPLQPIKRPYSFEPESDDEANSGLFYTNPIAQAGVIVYVVVAFGTSKLAPVMT